MWTVTKKLSYLKILAALAWADGELTNSELNYIKNLAIKFQLPDKVWNELEPLLYDAITVDEAEVILKNSLGAFSGQVEERKLLDALNDIANADDTISSEEREFINKTTRLLESGSSFSALKSSFKSLLPKNILTKEMSNNFARNKILYLLKRRIEQGKLNTIESGRLEYLALFGGILGRVAYADRDFNQEELVHLQEKLGSLANCTPQEAELIAVVVQDATLKGVDNAYLIADFFNNSTEEQRRQLLDCLFALSIADGKMSNEEIEEIRAIASGLGFSHKVFINAKLKARNSL